MKDKKFKIKKFNWTLPSFKMGVAQFAVSVGSWGVIAALIFYLFDGKVPFEQVLFYALAAAIAGVVTHVPGGLGVIEFVFLSLLKGDFSKEQVVAVLLAYRTLYYLVPLVLGLGGYILLESKGKPSTK